MALRVLTVYHGGRDPQHRERERALTAAGIELTLVAPSTWPEAGAEDELSSEPFAVVELPVKRPGDVNRHAYANDSALPRLIEECSPDILDIREEPFSIATRQWLSAAGADIPVVLYTAQNIDKRYPPPFAWYEQAALQRARGLYPCSRQAAAVACGKGFAGVVSVQPLGYDPEVFTLGEQTLDCDELTLMLAGRLVAEKGIEDAVHVLAHVNAVRPTRLLLVGEGPMAERAKRVAAELGVAGRVEQIGWQSESGLAAFYRSAHVVLVPSRATYTWAEQFGRVITEAQASGAIVAGYASGAIPEVAGEAGIVVAAGDAERLAQAVVEALSDAAGFGRRREAGQLNAAGRSWARVARTHLDLYRAVLAPAPEHTELPRAPERRRAAARAAFGETASALGGVRPFALPMLRNGLWGPRMLGRLIDAGSALRAAWEER